MRLSQQFSYQFAVLAIVCTALLFFFPAVRGSYSAVHGPVTAFRSVKTRLLVWFMVTQAALRPWELLVKDSGSEKQVPQERMLLARSLPSEAVAVLRC